VRVLRTNLQRKLVSQWIKSCLVFMFAIGLTSCEPMVATMPNLGIGTVSGTMSGTAPQIDGSLSEVNVPESIAKLAPAVDKYRPQVQILSPQSDQILTDDRVSVKLQVRDLPIFKSTELGLGNHLHVILDKQTYQGVYNLDQPLIFENLSPGTHSLRVFASRPWHESFKNPGAYAQTTFHVLTKTPEHNPNAGQPLLTYSRPTGNYGAEPIMLDYYLTNPPAQVVGKDSQGTTPNWQIRATVNNQSFIIDRWAPIYLQGFKQGKNWVRLELLDGQGNPLPNVYNDTLAIVTYNPQTQDTLAKLVRGEIDPQLAQSLIDPNYVAIKPTPAPKQLPPIIVTPVSPVEPVPTPITIVPPAQVPIAPSPVVRSFPSPIPTPQVLPPHTLAPSPAPIATPMATPTSLPSPTSIAPTPEPQPIPLPLPTAPTELHIPVPSPAPIPTAPAIAPHPVVSAPQPVPIIITPPTPIVTAPTPVAVRVPTQEQTQVRTAPAIESPIPTPIPTPKPLPAPANVATPQPTLKAIEPIPVPVQPQQPSVEIVPAPLPRPLPSPVVVPMTPTVITPTTAPVTLTETPSWQSQAIELSRIAGIKTREFTHTIPPKAQRFGRNVQIWFHQAIDQIQQWQASHRDSA
jgi:hypothetical protein